MWSDLKKWIHFCILDYKENIIYLEIKEEESKSLNDEIERLKKVIDNKNETIKVKDLFIDELMERVGRSNERKNRRFKSDNNRGNN